MEAALKRARKIRVLSIRLDSGSSATMHVEHWPDRKYPAWRHKQVMWRKGNSRRNAQTARGISQEIFCAEEVSPKTLKDNTFDQLWREVEAIVSGVLNAAFRGIDKHDLEAKKRDNAAKAKEARISAWRSNLKESIKGFLREGIVCEDSRC